MIQHLYNFKTTH